MKKAVLEVQHSTRAVEGDQAPLFAGMPDSPLPPHLLDQATQPVKPVSVDTLEFTSRLIERKLKDSGVEVNVIAAYPGPVITRYVIEPAAGVETSRIANLVEGLAHALSVASIRLVEAIPDKTCHGIGIAQPEASDDTSAGNSRPANVNLKTK